MRDSMIFYKSFADALKSLPDKDRLELYDAIFAFGIYDEEPKLSGVNSAVFTLVRPQIEANNRKYENGSKGGRPKNQTETKAKPNDNQSKTKPKPNDNQNITKTKPNHNQTVTKPKPNDNDNDNVNDNENEKGNENYNASGLDDISLSLLSYLNQKIGSSYSLTDQIRTVIKQRLLEGYTLDQMRSVIDKKCAEWSCDGKMRSYLRPSTLFGDRFEEYLNAPLPAEVEEERKSVEHVASLKKQLREKEQDHDATEKRLADIVQSGRYLSDLHDEYEELKLKSAILEQEIDNLKVRTGAA